MFPTTPFLRRKKRPTVTSITSGSGTYTPPLGTTRIVVEIWGGGASGGGGDGTNRGTGGGAGGYVKKLFAPPSASYAYSVGAAGALVGQGVAGNDGGNTTFGTLAANGGSGGTAATGTALAGRPGGAASGGDENIQGGPSQVLSPTITQTVSSGGDSPRGGMGGRENVGQPGLAPGGGGTCANNTGSSGAGAAGAIFIQEFYD